MNARTKHATRTAVSANGLRKAYGDKVVQLVTTAASPSSPAWDRLAEIAKQRAARG